MNKLAISPQAREDLEGIRTYISEELENPIAAVNMVSRITKKIKNLKKTPGIGAPLSSKVSFDTDYRTTRTLYAVRAYAIFILSFLQLLLNHFLYFLPCNFQLIV